MNGQRSAHHRSDNRDGPFHSWARRKAFLIQKLVAPGRVLERLLADARPIGINTYHIPGGAALLLRARMAVDEWRPLAEDASGEVWE